MKAKIVLKLFIVCPYCHEQEFGISHLPVGQDWGPWGCSACGKYFSGKRTVDGADIELRPDYKTPIVITMRYVHDHRLWIEVDSHRYRHSKLGVLNPIESPEEIAEFERYFYEESTCPTNYLSHIRTINFEQDDDPHGIFEIVKVEARLSGTEKGTK